MAESGQKRHTANVEYLKGYRRFKSCRLRAIITEEAIMADIDDIIAEMREEGTGSRGTFYESWGSGIREILVPLADLLEASKDEHPELVNKVATGMQRGYL